MTISRTSLRLAAGLAFAGAGSVLAQSNATVPGTPQSGGAGLRSGNIASTGQTVPNPRTLPTAPRSTIDRDLPSKDAGRRDYGICKGC